MPGDGTPTLEAINAITEQEDKERKESRRMRKQRQVDVEAGLHCNHPECSYVAVNKRQI